MEFMANVGEFDMSKNQFSLTEGLPHPLLDLGNGHTVTVFRGPWSRPVARSIPKWSKEAKEAAEDVRARLEEIHGKEYAAQLCDDEFNMLIFPNLAVNDHFSTNIRFLEPDGVGRMKANSWSLGPKEEPDVLREIRRKNFINFLGPGGLATPDDAEALVHCQKGYFNYPDRWNELSRGLKEETPVDTDELNLRVFWREWNRRMSQS
jgi:p-cumate 2,3-dioxygenase alpha subunit